MKRSKLVRENLNEALDNTDDLSYLNSLFNPHGIKVIKDFQEDGEGHEDMFENCIAYTQYSFEGPGAELLVLEVLKNSDGEKVFQFWYDASPIITGDGSTLMPDYQPFEDIDEYIDDVLEYV